MCCAAIQWLKDYNSAEKEKLCNEIEKLKISINEECKGPYFVENYILFYLFNLNLYIKMSACILDDDWINGEFNRIQKNVQMTSLQKQLNEINNRVEKINNLRERKKNAQNLNKRMVQNKWNGQKNKENSEIDKKIVQNDDIALDDPVMEDSDFLLEEISVADEEEEIEEEEIQNDGIKVNR